MTENKPIIIDGVDVAKCRNFTSEWDFNNCGHICKGTECKYKRLWYKKQLKAKEQECEELKKNVEHWKMEHKEAKAKGEWTCDLVKKRLGQQLDQLKTALLEIKEIAEYEFKELMNAEDYHNMTEVLKQILQIIDEVE